MLWAYDLGRNNKISLDSDDDFRSGCRNVSYHYLQQSFNRLWVCKSLTLFKTLL